MFNSVYPDVNQSEKNPLLKAIKAENASTIEKLVLDNPDSAYDEISQILKENKEVCTPWFLDVLTSIAIPEFWVTSCVPLDEPIRWLTLAAKYGYSPAQSRLGYAYQKGYLVKQDLTEALRWYRLAENKNLDEKMGLGSIPSALDPPLDMNLIQHHSQESDEKKSAIHFYLNQPEFKDLSEIFSPDRSHSKINLQPDAIKKLAFDQLSNFILTNTSSSRNTIEIAIKNIQVYLSRKINEASSLKKRFIDIEEINRFLELLHTCCEQVPPTDSLYTGITFPPKVRQTGSNFFEDLMESYLNAENFDEALEHASTYKKLQNLQVNDNKQKSIANNPSKKINCLKSIKANIDSILKKLMNLEKRTKDIKQDGWGKIKEDGASLLSKIEEQILKLGLTQQNESSAIYIKFKKQLDKAKKNLESLKTEIEPSLSKSSKNDDIKKMPSDESSSEQQNLPPVNQGNGALHAEKIKKQPVKNKRPGKRSKKKQNSPKKTVITKKTSEQKESEDDKPGLSNTAEMNQQSEPQKKASHRPLLNENKEEDSKLPIKGKAANKNQIKAQLFKFNSTEIKLTPGQNASLNKLVSLKIELSPSGTELKLRGSFVLYAMCKKLNKGGFAAHDTDAIIDLTLNPGKQGLVETLLRELGFKLEVIADTYRGYTLNDLDISVILPGFKKNDNHFLLTTVTMDFEKSNSNEYNFLLSEADAQLLSTWIERGLFPIELPEYNNTNVRYFFYRLVKYIDPNKNQLTPYFYFENPDEEISGSNLSSYWDFYFLNIYKDSELTSHLNHHYKTMTRIFEEKLYPRSDSPVASFLYHFCLAHLYYKPGWKEYKEAFASSLTASLIKYFNENPQEANNFSNYLSKELNCYQAPIILDHRIYDDKRQLEHLYPHSKDCDEKRINGRKIAAQPLTADQDLEEQFILGLRYEDGSGVKKDLKEAVRLYRLAADQGHAPAQNNLGACYQRGIGVDKDTQEAVRLYRLAANQEYAAAQKKLGFCYEKGIGVRKDLKEAVRLYRLAADQGYAAAQNKLGFCYEKGTGVEKDDKEAVRLYRLAADQGYTAAQYTLGFCYEKGTGVEKDDKEAVRLYRLAANQGYAKAQITLGICYQKGKGVGKDDKEAVGLYRSAADQDLPLAQYYLGVCYEHGVGVADDIEEALRLYRLAAAQGYVLAQYKLGVCYQYGNGVEKDDKEAEYLYRLAADQGNMSASRQLHYYYHHNNQQNFWKQLNSQPGKQGLKNQGRNNPRPGSPY